MIRKMMFLILAGTLFAFTNGATKAQQEKSRVFLIGNSLTWDTMPEHLDGQVQWHVDCGVSLPFIFEKPEKPCVKSSTLWPVALKENQYDFLVVQPHYGSTLKQDLEIISHWMRLQPGAILVVHSGWAFSAQQKAEFESLSTPVQMNHSPAYFRSLVSELRRLHPKREIRQTMAQNLLAQVAEDVDAGKAPIKSIAELYRDSIHMTHEHGKYLMHNAMRFALGQPFTAEGFKNLNPDLKKYLDSVLASLTIIPADKVHLKNFLANSATQERASIASKITDKSLSARLLKLVPEIERAAKLNADFKSIEAKIAAVDGKIVFSQGAPQWLYLATADNGMEIFDVPAALDLYNGNNPLKGNGGRNEMVNDAWLENVSGIKTLRRLDLANCAIKGKGLRHLANLKGLRELNLTLTPVSDDSLQHLAGLSELRTLGLASTQCTGSGFTHLTGLKKLESVNFHFTPLNDDGLRAISQVSISGRLWFAHTKFTDAGASSLKNLVHLKRCGIGSTDKASSGEAIAHLSKLPLEELSLFDNQATPAGIAHAAKIGSLRKLDVSHAPLVTDESLKLLAGMPSIEEFKLGSANVTNTGLQMLAGCKSLRNLSLSGLKLVTPEGVEQLRKARPELQVEFK